MSSPTDADGDDDFSMMMISCTANYMNCTKSTKEIAWLGVVHGILSSLLGAENLLVTTSEFGGRRKDEGNHRVSFEEGSPLLSLRQK